MSRIQLSSARDRSGGLKQPQTAGRRHRQAITEVREERNRLILMLNVAECELRPLQSSDKMILIKMLQL